MVYELKNIKIASIPYSMDENFARSVIRKGK
jgi:hypothetical protein